MYGPATHEVAGTAPAYRADIDGLRAVAVVAVILYHAGVRGFSGGYVGVDVFFVISGFLITQLLAGAGAGPLRMPLAEFYIRRARRILPALVVTALASTVAAVVLLLPWDLERFGKYLGATSLLLSNIPAWIEAADYFDSRILYVPLTHFWSIAVEEQFYLLYPAVLLAVVMLIPRRRLLVLAAIAGASFALCVWASYRHPIGNFFLAPTRAWELLLGAALAAGGMRLRWHAVALELLALASLAMLAAVVCCYAPTMRYPGLNAVAPCAASALLLMTGQARPTWTHRLLAWRPLVFTGLISYSLYLWHLPILLLCAYYHITRIGALGTAALLGAVYLIAALSWKFVEKPVRSRALLRSDRSFMRWAIAGSAVMLATGIILWSSKGLPQRFQAEVAAPDQEWMAFYGRMHECLSLRIEAVESGGLCSFGPQTDAAPRALLWGDSHALALLSAYERVANARHVRVYYAVKAACRPLLGAINSHDTPARQADCARFNAAVALAIGKLDPRLVILNAHWFDSEAPAPAPAGAAAARGESGFMRALERTLLAAGSASRAVCAVLDVPTYEYSVPYAVAMARRRGISEDFLDVRRTAALEEFRAPEQDFSTLQRRGLLRTTDLKDVLCRGTVCKYEAEGALLYSDRDHLSTAGATYVLDAVDACFRDAVPSAAQ